MTRDRFAGALRWAFLVGLCALSWLTLRGWASPQDVDQSLGPPGAVGSPLVPDAERARASSRTRVRPSTIPEAFESSTAERGGRRPGRSGAPATLHPFDEETRALARALERAVTVWHRPRDGRVVYVAHCQVAPGGCRARVRELALEMTRAGRAHHVDPWLLGAMALRESGLNPDAVGAVGETGVLQLHPRSARGHRARDACSRSPARCSAAVVWLAAEALEEAERLCGAEDAALGAYNRGRCGVTSYSTRVLRRREQLHESALEAEAAPGDGPGTAAERGAPEGHR